MASAGEFEHDGERYRRLPLLTWEVERVVRNLDRQSFHVLRLQGFCPQVTPLEDIDDVCEETAWEPIQALLESLGR